jgi:hypothetical protein
VVVADEDAIWHMLSGDLESVGGVVVVVGVDISDRVATLSFGSVTPCLALLLPGVATSFRRAEIRVEHHYQL